MDGSSDGVEQSMAFLNQPEQRLLGLSLATTDEKLKNEMDGLNFWSNGNFVIKTATCVGIVAEGLQFSLSCEVKDKPQERRVTIPFPFEVKDEVALKRALVAMASQVKRQGETGKIISLPFGESVALPLDFRFNDVPHAAWVRAYIYDLASNAIAQAVNDETIPDKSRLQMMVL